MSRLTLRKSFSLDDFDLQILAALQRDGRMTKVKLAEQINLSPTPCGTRVERLEKAGLIRGYHADVDICRLAALSRFRVFIEIMHWTPAKGRNFEAVIAKLPNFVECEAVLGDIDYIVTVLATSVGHFQELFDELVEAIPDEIDYTTYLVSKSVKRDVDVQLLQLSNRDAEDT